MTAHGSEETGRRRTRWWLLGLIAVVVLVPAAVTTYLVNREPCGTPLPALRDRGRRDPIDLGTLGGDVGPGHGHQHRWRGGGVDRGGRRLGPRLPLPGGTMTDLGASRYAKAINDAGQVLVKNWTRPRRAGSPPCGPTVRSRP